MKHVISLQEAIDMTSRYRSDPPDGMANSETFNKESVLAVLQQPECVSLRIYYGKKSDDSIHVILVGVDDKGADMIQSTEIILEEGQRCPPDCPSPPSPLNG